MQEIRVLIVEDDLIIARSMRLVLSDGGYHVCSIAISYEEAVDAMNNENPDIVIMDINLKGVDGINTAKALKKMGDVKIIYCTELTDSNSFNLAKETFPTHYLTKPFSNDDLLRAVALAAQGIAVQHPGSGPDSFLVEVKGIYKRIFFKDILYIKANGPYTEIVTDTANASVVVAITSKHVIRKIAAPFIVRAHRSYHLNVEKIESLHTYKAIIKGVEIPIASQYKDSIFNRFVMLTRETK